MKDKVFAGLVLVCGTILLQTHSIKFWSSIVGFQTGVLWSLLLEVAALWLWTFREKSKRPLGLLTTLVLLCGPLYDVGYPVLKNKNSQSEVQLGLELQISEKQELLNLKKQSLQVFLENSKGRTGWQTKIDEADHEIGQIAKELKQLRGQLLTHNSTQDLDFQSHLVIMLQILSILIFQSANVIAIQRLFNSSRSANVTQHSHELVKTSYQKPSDLFTQSYDSRAISSNSKAETSSFQDKLSNSSVTNDKAMTALNNGHQEINLSELKSKLKQRLETHRLSTTEFSNSTGIARQYLSYLLNYDPQTGEGRCPPASALHRIAAYLNQHSHGARS